VARASQSLSYCTAAETARLAIRRSRSAASASLPNDSGKNRPLAPGLKNRILLENCYLPGDVEARIEAVVAECNDCRYHESIDNLSPADVYFGRGRTILPQRERIKTQTIAKRRLQHQRRAAQYHQTEEREPLF
jgi:hypothetical protein